MEDNTIVRTYKYRMYLGTDQEKTLDDWVRLCRSVYNLCVEQRKSMYFRYNENSFSTYEKEGKITESYSPRRYTNNFEQQREITQLKKEFPEYAEVPAGVLAKISDRVDQAFKKYFSNLKDYRSGKLKKFPLPPGFSSRFDDFSLLHMRSNGFELQVLGNNMARIFGFPKLKDGIRVRYHRPIDGQVLQQQIKKEGPNWYLCISVEKEIVPLSTNRDVVGVDLGITRTAQLSTGKHESLPYDLLESLNQRKKVLQRRLKRKVGGNRDKKEKQSNNYKKAYQKIAKIDRKIANIKAYHLKRVATEIAKTHSVVVVEKLKVKNMTASAKGTIESPGNRIKQKSGLNRKILLTSPYFFRTFLKEKCREFGSVYIEVNPAYTSQMCSKCEYVNKDNRLTQSEFKCSACGFELNADHNAAINILNKGMFGLNKKAS
jgi:putative transposase